MFKLINIIFYLLSLLVFTLIGFFYAKLTGAAEGQGLAGGAIVLFYGIIFGVVALISSLFLSKFLDPNKVKTLNYTLLIILFGLVAAVGLQLKQNKNDDPKELLNKTEVNETIAVKEATKIISLPQENLNSDLTGMNRESGLGFFKPNIENGPLLIFYAPDETPQGKVIFMKTDIGTNDIAEAPSWFAPHHLKLDYDILYMKILSVQNEYVEIIVNKHTGKTLHLKKTAGQILYWPEFLLTVNSVDFKDDVEKLLRIKPLNHASLVKTNYDFLQVTEVKGDWLNVNLINDNYEHLGNAWIKWKSNGIILIDYYLLS